MKEHKPEAKPRPNAFDFMKVSPSKPPPKIQLLPNPNCENKNVQTDANTQSRNAQTNTATESCVRTDDATQTDGETESSQ